nr:DUF2188 domain-containing protein [uncultured Gellertiella sp.]
MSTNSKHVIPNGSKWSVRTTGAARASATFPTRKEAVDRACEMARVAGTDHYIHGKDGRIAERLTFGKDNPIQKA